MMNTTCHCSSFSSGAGRFRSKSIPRRPPPPLLAPSLAASSSLLTAGSPMSAADADSGSDGGGTPTSLRPRRRREGTWTPPRLMHLVLWLRSALHVWNHRSQSAHMYGARHGTKRSPHSEHLYVRGGGGFRAYSLFMSAGNSAGIFQVAWTISRWYQRSELPPSSPEPPAALAKSACGLAIAGAAEPQGVAFCASLRQRLKTEIERGLTRYTLYINGRVTLWGMEVGYRLSWAFSLLFSLYLWAVFFRWSWGVRVFNLSTFRVHLWLV